MKYLVLFLIIFMSFSLEAQENSLFKKLRNSKELLSIGVLTQKEFDSIVKEVKYLILNSESPKDLDGFYYQDKRIFPEVFSNHKIDMLGIMFSFGLAGGGTKSILTGSSSINQVDQNNQEIILIINRNVDVAGNTLSTITNDQVHASAQSPANFILIPLKVNNKKQQRSIKIGSFGLFNGPSFQIDSKYMLDFEWKEVSNSKFRIKTNLQEGEYAFVYKGTTSQFSSSPIYSFSVK